MTVPPATLADGRGRDGRGHKRRRWGGTWPRRRRGVSQAWPRRAAPGRGVVGTGVTGTDVGLSGTSVTTRAETTGRGGGAAVDKVAGQVAGYHTPHYVVGGCQYGRHHGWTNSVGILADDAAEALL